MGVVIGSAVCPIAFSITWAKCSCAGAVTGAIGGLCGGLITWLATARALSGTLSIATLGGDFPMLAGNVTAIGFSALLCTVISLIKPQNFDWELMKEIPMVEDDPAAHLHDVSVLAICRSKRRFCCSALYVCG
jgi:Na+/proline symporter